MRVRTTIAAVAIAVTGVASVAVARDPSPPPNGGFEEGNFSHWNQVNDGAGDWFIYGTIPSRGGGGTPPPPRGNYAALLDQFGPGFNMLHRVVRLDRNDPNRISIFIHYRNQAERFWSPNSFEYGDDGPMLRSYSRRGAGAPPAPPNQQLRVEILKAGAPARTLAKDNILATLLRTRPGDRQAIPYQRFRVNLTKLGIKANRVRVRIAEVDNEGNFRVGVDQLTHNGERIDR